MVKKTRVSRIAPKSKPNLSNASMNFVMNSAHIPKGIPRYRDPDVPVRTWSGHGRKPGWLCEYLEQGRSLEEFEIPKSKSKGKKR